MPTPFSGGLEKVGNMPVVALSSSPSSRGTCSVLADLLLDQGFLLEMLPLLAQVIPDRGRFMLESAVDDECFARSLDVLSGGSGCAEIVLLGESGTGGEFALEDLGGLLGMEKALSLRPAAEKLENIEVLTGPSISVVCVGESFSSFSLRLWLALCKFE
jgi:hypothetical protein